MSFETSLNGKQGGRVEEMEERRTYGFDDTAHLGTLGLVESDRHLV